MAIGCGVLLFGALLLLTRLATVLFPTPETPASGGSLTAFPAWFVLLGVLTTAFFEEVIWRAYLMEQLAALTGRMWPGAALALAAFTAMHLSGWSLGHVVFVVLPLGAVLTLLYARRRNLLFVSIAHFMIDLPLVLLAAGVLPAL
jgi:membrane protease YdiL (CAAX protease family)